MRLDPKWWFMAHPMATTVIAYELKVFSFFHTYCLPGEGIQGVSQNLSGMTSTSDKLPWRTNFGHVYSDLFVFLESCISLLSSHPFVLFAPFRVPTCGGDKQVLLERKHCSQPSCPMTRATCYVSCASHPPLKVETPWRMCRMSA